MQVPEEEQAPSTLHLPNKDSSVFRGQNYLFFRNTNKEIRFIWFPSLLKNSQDSKASGTALHCWANFVSSLQLREQTPLDFDSSGLCLTFTESGEQLLSMQPSDFKYLLPAHRLPSSLLLNSGAFAASASRHWKATFSTCMYFFPFPQVLAK